MMRRESRLLMGLAALALIPVYFLPLWSIRIVAPQYREGLGMYIGLRDIWGHGEHDITNINIVNHYIGMKPIDPATVDVLTIMPWIVGVLMVAALVVALIGRRKLVAAWLVAFALLGAAGFYEFWSWNYDYGHNLSPDAPIKVPGMTYQPPILGYKTLLNFHTSSLPSWGTLFVALSFGLGVAALLRGRRRPEAREETQANGSPARRSRVVGKLPAAVALLATFVLATGCGPEAQAGGAGIRLESTLAEAVPEWATYGMASDFCEGVIPDSRFGGELETDTRVYRFMSAECLAGFVASGEVSDDAIRSVRVIDFNHGERLIDARTAYYVRMQFERSPNGLNIAATQTDKVAASIHYFLGGERLTWDELVALVKREWDL
jgi:copper chaperone NosL